MEEDENNKIKSFFALKSLTINVLKKNNHKN